MLPQAVEFRISDAAGIARIPTAIDPGGAVLVSGTLARLQDRWKVGECSRSSKHDCGTRATYWHEGLNGAFSLCPWLLDLKLTSCRDLPLSLDYKTDGVSSRCSSPAGITRVELGLENLDLNPRPPRPNPRTARHLH
jgi:hypothetical protein